MLIAKAVCAGCWKCMTQMLPLRVQANHKLNVLLILQIFNENLSHERQIALPEIT